MLETTAYFFLKEFIAMISKSGTCRVTKLFLNNNQFTAVSLQNTHR